MAFGISHSVRGPWFLYASDTSITITVVLEHIGSYNTRHYSQNKETKMAIQENILVSIAVEIYVTAPKPKCNFAVVSIICGRQGQGHFSVIDLLFSHDALHFNTLSNKFAQCLEITLIIAV